MGEIFSVSQVMRVSLKSNLNITLILAFYIETVAFYCGIPENFWHFDDVERFCTAIDKLYLVMFGCLSFKILICCGKYIKII